MNFRQLSVIISLVACLFVLGFSVIAQESDFPHIEWAECPFELPEGEVEGETIECGYLFTYEDHFSEGDTAEVEIAFAILYSPDDSRLDPVIYLEGGPGGSALHGADEWAPSAVRLNNDLILVDQRGTGYSLPSLNCIELEEYTGDAPLDAEQACFERFMDEGINLNAYNSAQSAADIADLMVLLQEEFGYTEFNLLGISYGTRLALTLMRDYPENIRSAILDSVYPPNENAYELQPTHNYQGLAMLFDGCDADAACAAAYPDLEAVFYDIYESLNGTPAVYEAEDWETGDMVDAELTGDMFLDMIVEYLYDTKAIPELPLVIYEVSEGNYGIVDLIGSGEIAGLYSRPLLRQDDDVEGDTSDSEGMFNVVECKEELPFNTLDATIAASAHIPEPIRDYLISSVENQFFICQIYGLEPADSIETEAVVSDIPALVLAGDYDPITPPSSAILAAETLSNSYYFEFPGYGHGITDADDCAKSIIAQFLEDPMTEPDGACVAEIAGPAFITR